MQLAKYLGYATVVTAISVVAIAPKPVQAAIVKYNFTVTSDADQYFGYLKYDDSTLTGLGNEIIGVENGLAVTFNYLGNTYTEKDDPEYDFFPIVTFDNGKIQGLSYGVLDKFVIGSDVDTPEIGGNKFYIFDAPLSVTQTGTVSYSKVPEPLAAGGTAIATTIALFRKRQKKATAIAE